VRISRVRKIEGEKETDSGKQKKHARPDLTERKELPVDKAALSAHVNISGFVLMSSEESLSLAFES